MAGADGGGKTVPLADQEPVSCDAQGGVMVKTAPTPSFIVTQPQLLLQFLIIAFDDPAVFSYFHQRLQRGLLRHRGEPVFGGLQFFLRPFDQEPFFRIWLGALVIAMRRAHADCGEAGVQSLLTALAPTKLLPGRRRQAEGQLLYRNGLMVRIALGGAPRPGFRAGAGKGCCPGSQTVALDSMPTTYCSPSWVRSVRNCVPFP